MLSLLDYITEYARQMMDLRYVALAKVKFDMQFILRKRITRCSLDSLMLASQCL